MKPEQPEFLRVYDFSPPVFKKGDDMASCLEDAAGDPKGAFVFLAEQYEESARMCRRMASVAAEMPSMKVYAETHMIEVSGDQTRLDALAKDGLLTPLDYENPDFDDSIFEDEDTLPETD